MESAPDWARYTKFSRRAIHLAAREAARLGAQELSGAHLLLGILADDDPVDGARHILVKHGVALDQVRSAVESHLPHLRRRTYCGSFGAVPSGEPHRAIFDQ
jgi:ATP-dependent Clp protease ATP-binding subunit ClpA